MKRIILIACASKKLSHKAKAKDLYISPLFKYNLKYAKTLNPDKIFILSAKHGLLDLEEEIQPYDKTLKNMHLDERRKWSEKVIKQLQKIADLDNDKIIFLAGEKYREFLIPEIKNYEVPLKNMGIGKQLGFLKQNTQKQGCEKLHNLFNGMERFNFPFDENEIPLNGIYILFEEGERKGDFDRIVRVGTHTGDNQLRSRLKQHFVNENKDRSIFRKNIGRAILNKKEDPYLKIWEIDFTTRDARERFGNLINWEKQKQVERKISEFIQDNFSFVLIPMDDKNKRLNIESKIISTVSRCNNCSASSEWLGLFSPKDKIKKSGLWLVNELYKETLSDEEIEEIKKTIESDKK